MVHTPEISQRVHHATDEEKLASTGIMSLATDSPEDPECTKAPGKQQADTDGMFGLSDTSQFVELWDESEVKQSAFIENTHTKQRCNRFNSNVII